MAFEVQEFLATLDSSVALSWRAFLCFINLTVFLTCCCCYCCKWHQLRNFHANIKQDKEWSRQSFQKAYREDPDIVKEKRVGHSFGKNDWERFQRQILTDSEEVEFIARICKGNETWDRLAYEDDKATTEKLNDLRARPGEEAQKKAFHDIFRECKIADSDSSDDEEDRLLVKANDGLTPGLYIITEPVEETKTHELPIPGRPNGHTGNVDREGTASEKEDWLYNVGDLVYVRHLCYVPYVSHRRHKARGDTDPLIALRGKVHANGWITIQSNRKHFARKHPIVDIFNDAKTQARAAPTWKKCPRFCWLVLGHRCHMLIYLAFSIAFLAGTVHSLLPTGEIDKELLLYSFLVFIIVVVLGVIVVLLHNSFIYYLLPSFVRKHDDSKQEITRIKDILLVATAPAREAVHVAGKTAEVARETMAEAATVVGKAAEVATDTVTSVQKGLQGLYNDGTSSIALNISR